jgi:hypothetical protein
MKQLGIDLKELNNTYKQASVKDVEKRFGLTPKQAKALIT